MAPRTVTRTWAPLPELADCLHSVVLRDTRGVELAPADRLTYGPVGPQFSISWYLGGLPESINGWHPDDLEWPRTPVETRVVFAGASSRPWMAYWPGASHTYVALFHADAVAELFGLDPRGWVDRHAPFDEALVDQDWAGWARAILRTPGGVETVREIQEGLRRLRPSGGGAADRGRLGAWLRPGAGAVDLAPGRADRLARAEEIAHAAASADQPRSEAWSRVADKLRLTDAVRFSSEIRGITGFDVGETLRRAFVDESFWLYRAFFGPRERL